MSTANEMDNNEALLGALQQVRLISAIAKVDATVEIAKKTLENEPAGKFVKMVCAVFVAYSFSFNTGCNFVSSRDFH